MKTATALHRPGTMVRSGSDSLRNHIQRCANQVVCLRLVAEYGGVFAASPYRVLLPANNSFAGEVEVQSFQQRAGIASHVVDGVLVQLQREALKSFLNARDDAKRQGIRISLRGAHPSRRSYGDTLQIWRDRVRAALAYWLGRRKLTSVEAAQVRLLPPERQIQTILMMERKGLLFGIDATEPILQSVALPGASQHNLMLALDIEQHDNPDVRSILARRGWFQTVRNDRPHFTYLGVPESTLTSLGLRRSKESGRTFWTPGISVSNSGRQTVTGNGNTANAKVKKSEGPKADNRADAERGGLAAFTAESGGMTKRRGERVGNVLTPSALRPILRELIDSYFERAGTYLHITSGFRSPQAQAEAMYHNLRAYGKSYVSRVYGGSAAAIAIIELYSGNQKNRAAAINSMAAIIQSQVAAGVYVSRHLLGKAFDIRLRGTNLSVLRKIVRSLGGRLGVERDHYHVEF